MTEKINDIHSQLDCPVARYRARHREKKLCLSCNSAVEPGKIRCRVHLDSNKASVIRTRKAKGEV